jgi:iron complex outermembrane receptor protein
VTFPTAGARGTGTGVIPGRFYIPATNPGLRDLLNRYTPAQLGLTQAQYDFARANGVNAAANWRPVGEDGNAAFGGRNVVNIRDYKTYRVSGGFSGKLPFAESVNWDVNLTVGSNTSVGGGVDHIVNRLQYALRGLGGPGCTPGGAVAATSTPGVGPCSYYNPFSTAMVANALTGKPNTGLVGNLNSPQLIDWFTGDTGGTSTNGIVVGEAVLNGELGFWTLPGGPIGWAAGAQYRLNKVEVVALNDLANFFLYPCTREGAPLSECADAPTGVHNIFGPTTPREYDETIKGFFGELSLPLLDSVQMQIAVRHEVHEAGETTNPKIAIRWQATDWLALRASAQSTYRAPIFTQLDNTFFGTVSQPVGTIRIPIDNTGNPDLKPETANNYNVGAIISAGPFRATVDYWKYDLKDLLSAENGPALVNALIPATGPNRCNDPAFADLKARFTFNASGCGLVTDILRVKALATNGAGITTSGIDASAEYRWADVWGGQLIFGGDLSYTFEYLVGASEQFGITLIPAFDAVGKFNSGLREQLSMPQWKAQLFLDYSKGPHNLRYQIRYADDVLDQRAGNGTASDLLNQIPGFPAGTRALGGMKIRAWTQHDVHYRVELPYETTATFSIINIFNPDPGMARNEYSYDTFTATPLGRVFKLGVVKTF